MNEIMAVALGTSFAGGLIGLAFGLLIGRELKIPVYEDELKKIESTIKKTRSINVRLRRENSKLRKEHQALYDCVAKWYEETGKLFKSFMEVKLGKEIEDETNV